MESSSFRSDEADERNGKGDMLTDKHEIDVKENQQPDNSVVILTGDGDVTILEGPEETTGTATASGELMDLDQEEEVYWTFPDLAVIKILKFTNEQKTFLNCRLVCTQWNNIIQDTSKLMKKIEFYVSNRQEFVELPIVKQMKIKSIVIKTCSALKFVSEFVDLIKNIEKVTFAMHEKLYVGELKLVLEKCANLHEIRFNGCFGIDGLWPNVTEAIEIAAALKISLLSFSVNGLSRYHVAGISALLPKLPVLKELVFNGDCHKRGFIDIDVAIINMLISYLDKCDLTSLKELSLKPIRDLNNTVDFSTNSGFGLLLVLCGKHGIHIEEMPYLDLKWLLRIDGPMLDSILDGPLSLKSKRAAADCFILFNDISHQLITNSDRFHLINIGKLGLDFKLNLVDGELSSWFGALLMSAGLENLTLRANVDDEDGMNLVSNIEMDAAFSLGYLSLHALHIYNNVFDSIRILQLAQYFPNLNELYFNRCRITPDNLIVELTKLRSLAKLSLLYLPNLADAAFTMECVKDRNASACNDADATAVGPAIAGFKSLKYLYLESCPLLTNSCVINGIDKSKTLEEVIILYCRGITKENAKLVIKCKQGY